MAHGNGSRSVGGASVISPIHVSASMPCGNLRVGIVRSATCLSSSFDKPSAKLRRVCERTAPSESAPTARASLTRRRVRSSSGPASEQASSGLYRQPRSQARTVRFHLRQRVGSRMFSGSESRSGHVLVLGRSMSEVPQISRSAASGTSSSRQSCRHET